MAGILGIGNSYRQNAMRGFGVASDLENRRVTAEESLKHADEAQRMSNIGTGAGLGMMAGMQAGSVGGPWGAAIGAGVGYLVSEIF